MPIEDALTGHPLFKKNITLYGENNSRKTLVRRQLQLWLGTQSRGAIIVAEKTLDGIKKAFLESLQFHIDGMKEDGLPLPEWLADGNYEVEFKET